MRKVLFVKHEETEGPGFLEDAFRESGWNIGLLEVWKERRLSFEGADVVVSLGGPMSAHDDCSYPFISEEICAVQERLDSGRPFVGICLGAQLLSLAGGGLVSRGIAAEKGHYEVALTRAGLSDPLFRGFPATVPVFQWHNDVFTVPPGGERLAEGVACLNQAFRLGNAVGIQFHLEIGQAEFEKMAAREATGNRMYSVRDIGVLSGFAGREMQYRLLCSRLARNVTDFLCAAY